MMKKLFAIIVCAILISGITGISAFAAGADNQAGNPYLDAILKDYNLLNPTDFGNALGMLVMLESKTDDPYWADIYVFDKGEGSFEEFAEKRAGLLNSRTFPIEADIDADIIAFPALVRYQGDNYQSVTYLLDTDSPIVLEVDFSWPADEVSIGDSGIKMLIPTGWKKGKLPTKNAKKNYEYDRYPGYKDNHCFVDRITVYEWPVKNRDTFVNTVIGFSELNGMSIDLAMIDGEEQIELEKQNEKGEHIVEYWFMKGKKGYAVRIEAPAENRLAIDLIKNTFR